MSPSLCLSLSALLIVALAGCVEAPIEDDEASMMPTPEGPVFRDGTPAPVQDVLSDCYESAGSFAVPVPEYWDRLPPGFGMAPYSAVGTVPPVPPSKDTEHVAVGSLGTAPPDPTAFTGEIVAVASACHDASGAVVNRLGVFLMVEPPEDLHNDAALFGHILLLAYFTDSQAHGDLMEAWGFGHVVQVGPMTASVDDNPAVRASETEGSVDSFTARLATLVAGQPTAMEGSAARFFATDAGGNLSGIADASFGSFDAMAGQASLAGSDDAGIWQSGADLSGLGLQIWGHTNTWDYVSLADPDDVSDPGALDP